MNDNAEETASREKAPATEPEAQIIVRVLDKKMQAELSVPANFPPDAISQELLIAKLREAGVLISVDVMAQIEKILQRINDHPDQPAEMRIEGTAPVAGENASIEWVEGFDPTLSQQSCGAEGDERVDHYNRKRYVTVENGALLGTIHAATPGEDGMDVTGQTLAATPGRDLSVEMDGTITQRNMQLYANESGVVRYDRGKLWIDKDLQIESHVDFSTGNIFFNGNVDIHRGIRDKFIVQASGSITSQGLVEAARLRSGQSIYLRGGMAAKETGQVFAGGDIEARYMDNVCGRVERDVHIDKGMFNCAFIVGGDLMIMRGGLAGGIQRVAGRVCLAELGAASGDRTVLVIGSMPDIEDALAMADHALEQMRDEIHNADEKLNMMHQMKAGRTASQKEELCEIMCERDMLAMNYERIEKKCSQLRDYLISKRKVDLTVERVIHPGTIIASQGLALTVDEDIRGPIHVGLRGRAMVMRIGTEGQAEPINRFGRVRSYTTLEKIIGKAEWQRLLEMTTVRDYAAQPEDQPDEQAHTDAAA